MKTVKLYINDEEKLFQRLRYTDYVKKIGDFSGQLDNIHDVLGLSTVKIDEDGEIVFQGLVEQPDKEVSRESIKSNLSGPEWTARLMHHYCPQETAVEGEDLTDALSTVLTNSPFTTGDVDDFESELDPTLYDTTLEFLGFDYTDTCIVYTTTEELHDELTAGTFEMPPPNRRACFYSKTTGYFYVVAYDNDNNLLKYNSTNDGVTWKGWTSLGFNAGDDGSFGLTWDEDNGRLFLLAYDGANIDYYRYSEAGGTLTQQDTDNDVCAGELVCGPVLDSSGDVWFICSDAGEGDYELWEFDYSISTWAEKSDWAIADNDDPKYMFMGDDAGDIIVVMWDDDNNDIDEWLWDQSGASFAYVRKIEDIHNDDCGYVSGYQDAFKNMFIIWEDEYAAGDADLYFSYRYIDETSWVDSEKVIDDDQYQTVGNFSLSGDYGDDLYLWYENYEAAGTPELYIARRLEGTWETAVDTTYDINDGSGIQAPENGLAQFCFWLDADDDVHFMLLAPYGITSNREFDWPWFCEDHESTNDYTGSYTSTNCTVIATDTSRPFSGVKNMKSTIPAGSSNKHALYYKSLGGSWGNRLNLSAKNVRFSAELDTNGQFIGFLRAGESSSGWSMAFLGVYRQAGTMYWALYYFVDGVGLSWQISATQAYPDTNYRIELEIYRDDAAGYVRYWVNNVLIDSVTGFDNLDANYELKYASFGLNLSDAPAGESMVVTLDDCRISTRRIDQGKLEDGYVETDTITASGAFTEWGTLDSEGVNNYDTIFDVEDNVGVDIVTGLNVPVDLEVAGVPNTELNLQIEIYIINRGESQTYVYELSIAEKGTALYGYHDAENTYLGIGKYADQLDAEYKLRYDDTLDFLTALGEDKSSDIKLFTARSQSLYPGLEPTLLVARRSPDFGYYANCVLVIGGTPEGGSRVYATSKDMDEIDTMSERLGGTHNGEIWYVHRDPELLTTAECQNTANIIRDARVSVYEQLYGQVRNSDLVDGLDVGDTITLHDRWTDIDSTARVMGLYVDYDGKGNKSVSLDLLKTPRSAMLQKHIGSIQDLMRYITA